MDRGYSLWLESENKKNIQKVVSREEQLQKVHSEALELFKKKKYGLWRCFCEIWNNWSNHENG